jgi:hypothetical protein
MRVIAAPIVAAVATAIALAGCRGPLSPAEENESAATGSAAATGVATRAAGGGHYTITSIGLELQFAFSALLLPNGRAEGEFHHWGIAADGLIDFKADVTCMSVDAVNHRAWIGGVITRNDSTHPGFLTPVHEPGHDIWFRVQDNGSGLADAPPDVTTIVGFEGIFPSSAAYCAQKPWNPANVWPVVGNLTVVP